MNISHSISTKSPFFYAPVNKEGDTIFQICQLTGTRRYKDEMKGEFHTTRNTNVVCNYSKLSLCNFWQLGKQNLVFDPVLINNSCGFSQIFVYWSLVTIFACFFPFLIVGDGHQDIHAWMIKPITPNRPWLTWCGWGYAKSMVCILHLGL